MCTDPATWFKTGKAALDAAEIEQLIQARNAAHSARNCAEADRIRDELPAGGVLLEDAPEGTRWRLAG